MNPAIIIAMLCMYTFKKNFALLENFIYCLHTILSN